MKKLGFEICRKVLDRAECDSAHQLFFFSLFIDRTVCAGHRRCAGHNGAHQTLEKRIVRKGRLSEPTEEVYLLSAALNADYSCV